MLGTVIAIMMQATPAVTEPPPVTRPTWVRRPSAQQYAQTFPIDAQRANLAGKGTLDCVVTAEGTLSACSILSQEPSDGPFGEAAIRISPWFKMLPTDAENQPTAGRHIRVPIVFLLPRAAQVSPMRVKVAQHAGAEIDVDCRFRGATRDNCLIVRSAPRDPALDEAALELVKRLPMPKPPLASGRVLLPLRFVAD